MVDHYNVSMSQQPRPQPIEVRVGGLSRLARWALGVCESALWVPYVLKLHSLSNAYVGERMFTA
jgi:hypothetical protein